MRHDHGTPRDATPARRRNGGASAQPAAHRRGRRRRASPRRDRLLLEEAGHAVVGRSGDADDLLLKVRSYTPDIAIVDVRMPPRQRRRRARRGREIRPAHPSVAVLVLSQHLEPTPTCSSCVGDDAAGVGYLLKDRVRDVAEFLDAVERVAAGGTAFDPEVVKSLVGGHRRSALDELTDREREVLALVAEGRSNRAIAKQLYLSTRAVERDVQAIFQKLQLPGHRRRQPARARGARPPRALTRGPPATAHVGKPTASMWPAAVEFTG